VTRLWDGWLENQDLVGGKVKGYTPCWFCSGPFEAPYEVNSVDVSEHKVAGTMKFIPIPVFDQGEEYVELNLHIPFALLEWYIIKHRDL